MEIHSRKSQDNRNKASDKFRTAKSCAILFTSDISARGVHYPRVTTVIQFGLTDSRGQYIHRLGRTGRPGKAGKEWLVLADDERRITKIQNGSGGGVDVPPDDELQASFAAPPSPQVMDMLTPLLQDIGNGPNE